MSTFTEFLDSHIDDEAAAIFKRIMAQRPTEKSPTEQRFAKREAKYGRNFACYMQQIERRPYEN